MHLEGVARMAGVEAAPLEAPAGDQREEALDSLDAHLVLVDHHPHAPDPFNVILRIAPVFAPPVEWNDQSLLFVIAESLDRNADQVRRFADREEGFSFP
jgi:hypothetical protein